MEATQCYRKWVTFVFDTKATDSDKPWVGTLLRAKEQRAVLAASAYGGLQAIVRLKKDSNQVTANSQQSRTSEAVVGLMVHVAWLALNGNQ